MKNLNPNMCSCPHCRNTHKAENKPGYRDGKRKYKNCKNIMRKIQFKIWIKKLRQYKGEDYYNPKIMRYTD